MRVGRTNRRRGLFAVAVLLALGASGRLLASEASATPRKFCRIEFKSSSLACEVSLNGVSLVKVPKGRNLSTTFVVNEWVENGDNQLSVDLTGNGTEPSDAARVHVEVGISDSPQGKVTSVVTLDLGPKDVASAKVTKRFALPTMAFGEYDDQVLRPIDLRDSKQKRDFLRAYNAYYEAMAHKKIDAVMRLHGYRCAAYDKRYYSPSGDRCKSLRKELLRSFKTEFLLKRLARLEQINSHRAGTLLTVDYSDDGNPMTSYTDQTASYTHSYQAYWGRNEKGEYFIYR